MIIFNIIILLFLLFLNIFFSYELLVNIEDYLEVHNHLKKSIGLPVIGCYFNNRLQVNYVARSEKKNQAYARSFSSSSIVAQSEKNINTDIDNNNDDIIENKFNIVNIVNSNNINSNNNNNNVPNKNVHNNNININDIEKIKSAILDINNEYIKNKELLIDRRKKIFKDEKNININNESEVFIDSLDSLYFDRKRLNDFSKKDYDDKINILNTWWNEKLNTSLDKRCELFRENSVFFKELYNLLNLKNEKINAISKQIRLEKWLIDYDNYMIKKKILNNIFKYN